MFFEIIASIIKDNPFLLKLIPEPISLIGTYSLYSIFTLVKKLIVYPSVPTEAGSSSCFFVDSRE